MEENQHKAVQILNILNYNILFVENRFYAIKTISFEDLLHIEGRDITHIVSKMSSAGSLANFVATEQMFNDSNIAPFISSFAREIQTIEAIIPFRRKFPKSTTFIYLEK